MTRPLRAVPDEPPATPRDVTTEKGHGQLSDYWAMLDDEPTPELQWPQSVAVYDRMRRQDAQVVSVIRAVTLPIRRAHWRIHPGLASDEVVQFVAENLNLPIVGQTETIDVRRTRDRFSWAQHLQWALLMTVYGHMFFEQVYRVGPDGKLWIRKLAPRWPKTLQEIRTASDGGLDAIVQRPLPPRDGRHGIPEPVVLPVDRLVAYVNEREGSNWTGLSLLRAAYKHWLLKDRALRTWSQRDDRNSMGVPVYTGADGEEDLAHGEKIARRHRSGESAGAAIPFGARLELMGVTGALPDVERQVRYQDEQIGRAVLAHFLNLGNSTGSWALGNTFSSFFVMSLESLAGQIADIATQHIVEDLVDLNWGPDEPAPRIIHDPIGQDATAVIQAVKTLIEAGAIFPDPALDAFVRQLSGLPPKAPLPNATTPAGAAENPPETT